MSWGGRLLDLPGQWQLLGLAPMPPSYTEVVARDPPVASKSLHIILGRKRDQPKRKSLQPPEKEEKELFEQLTKIV